MQNQRTVFGQGGPVRTKLAHYKITKFAEHLLFLPILPIISNGQQNQNNMENLLRNSERFQPYLTALSHIYNSSQKSSQKICKINVLLMFL
jgi:hypothetical protein